MSTTVAPGTEFTNPLILTTPYMSGQKVKDAQWLLAGHNVFSSSGVAHPLHTLTGQLDGQYGPVTAGAVKEAKYELGYPEASVDTVFGQVLYDYLTGKLHLPAQNITNRAQRLAVPNKVKALEYAITQIGVHENPAYSNNTPYGVWYGFDYVPWCAIFASYCINEALGILANPVWKYSYVPAIAAAAALGQNHMSLTYSPYPGDLVTYNWDGPNAHVEFFEHFNADGSFSAVGGNTGAGNTYSYGGEVCRNMRYYSQVSHFIRLSI